jgi:hypothetical protein
MIPVLFVLGVSLALTSWTHCCWCKKVQFPAKKS